MVAAEKAGEDPGKSHIASDAWLYSVLMLHKHTMQHQKNSHSEPFNALGLTTRHMEEHQQHLHFVWGLDRIVVDSIYRPINILSYILTD